MSNVRRIYIRVFLRSSRRFWDHFNFDQVQKVSMTRKDKVKSAVIAIVVGGGDRHRMLFSLPLVFIGVYYTWRNFNGVSRFFVL